MSKLKYYDGTEWKTVNGQITGDTLPIGSMVPYGSTTAPTNWLICDGSAVSRTTYSELFAVIGTSYGAGDGSTTFNLPNYKGRVPVGYDSTQTEFDTLGETGGEKTHTLTTTEMPSHEHAVRNNWGGIDSSANTGTGSWGQKYNYATSGASAISTNAYKAQASGGNGAHNNLQPYQVSCFIIKAKQSAGLVGNVVNTHSNSQEDAYNCKHINDMMDYSTTEVNTGKKWIDGKDIYKKVYYIASLPNATSQDYDPGISNMNYLVDMSGTIIFTGGFMPINTPRPDANGSAVAFYWQNNKIKVISPSDRSSWSCYVILEYTKTN